MLNVGQIPSSVASNRGAKRSGTSSIAQTAFQLRVLQANAQSPILKEQSRLGVSNYFIGNDPSKWHRDVPHFGALRHQAIYPGIDWLIYGDPEMLEYDFIIAPHVDPAKIRLAVAGADRLVLDGDGNILITVGSQTLHQLKPAIYQTSASGKRQMIDGHYAIDGNELSFVVGSYDPTRELVIDPVLAFSTYFGGSLGDYGYGIAVDNTGSIYVVGQASSSDFPTANEFQGANTGDNAFVAKFNATGNELIYSTYLGGSGGEKARAVSIDGAGNAYVTGSTFSLDFPTANAFQSTFNTTGTGSNQAFLTKLNPAGNALVYSTYLGGSGDLNSAVAISVDGTGSAYIAGSTNSRDFPVAGGVQTTLRGRLNAFVTKFSPIGSSLDYSTYLGGSAADQADAVAIDAAGNAYVTGNTNSANFPLANAYQTLNKAIAGGSTNSTVFVSKINPAGSALLYSTYLGGSTSDVPSAIAVDTAGAAYVTGSTCSTDFPTVNAFQSARNSLCAGGPNVFVTKLNPSGSGLVYSTYLGGTGGGNGLIGDDANGIAIDSTGQAIVIGSTTSQDFPLAQPLQSVNRAAAVGASNAFIAQLSADGSALAFSTYFGGSGSWGPTSVHTTAPFGDSAAAVALDSAGNIYITGQTGSSDFPTEKPYQATNKTTTTYGSAPTAFVTKVFQQTVTAFAAPASLTATASATLATLTWSAVDGATSYNIYEGSAPGAEATSPVQTVYTGTAATFAGLSSGTSYYYVVTAVNVNGESQKSTEVSVTPSVATAKGGGGGSVGWGLLFTLGLTLLHRYKSLCDA
jgi:hypothetical protein